jgi:hypothetical protein
MFATMASQRRCRYLRSGEVTELVMKTLNEAEDGTSDESYSSEESDSNESIQPIVKWKTCQRMLVLCGKRKHILPHVHFTLTTHPAV